MGWARNSYRAACPARSRILRVFPLFRLSGALPCRRPPAGRASAHGPFRPPPTPVPLSPGSGPGLPPAV